MKPFKTYNQQLRILRNRGLIISNGSKAIRILERENYYTLINGYKFFFLERDSNGKPVSPERYKSGTTFEEIYTLFLFDRELRNCILEYLLIFESSIKTKLSYRFSERFKEAHDYLIYKNYTNNPLKTKDVLSVIATLSSTLKSKSKNQTIKHYLDIHGSVPLWVLVKYLSFGNLNYLYNTYSETLRNTIDKDFSIAYKRDYKESIHITPDILDSIFQSANFYRNVCAHEERLYNFRIRKKPSIRAISNILNIPQSDINNGNLFSMLAFLKLVLTKKDYSKLLNRLNKLFCSYSTKLTSVEFSDIMLEMGFDENWMEKLK